MSKIYLVPFATFPKLQLKHDFVNLGWNMNFGTHQYKQLDYKLMGIKGELAGEFL